MRQVSDLSWMCLFRSSELGGGEGRGCCGYGGQGRHPRKGGVTSKGVW